MPIVLICKMETASFKAVGRDRFCISTRGPKHSLGSLHTLPVPPPVAEATMQAGWENQGPRLPLAHRWLRSVANLGEESTQHSDRW